MSERYTWEKAYCGFEDLMRYRNNPEASQIEHGGISGKTISERKKIYDEWAVEGRSTHEKYKLFSGMKMITEKNYKQFISEISWLEKRRWNAFIRVQGFSAPFDSIQDLVELIKLSPNDVPKVFKEKNMINKLQKLHKVKLL